MSRWEALGFAMTSLAVSVTGLVYFWMKYFLRNDDPFALVNHPWQQTFLKLHILSAPALILIVGILFKSHFLQKYRLKEKGNRLTGMALMSSFPAMVLSGYALQVVVEPFVLEIAIVLHLGTGAIFSAACVAHLITGFKLGNKKVQAWWNRRRIAA